MFDDKDAVFAVMRAAGGSRVQDLLVEPTRLLVRQAKMGQGGGDPVVLGLGEGNRVSRAAGHNRPLEGHIPAAQDRVGTQGVPQAPHGGHLRTASWDHVHVDPVLTGPVAEGAPQHGPGWRERRRTLGLEAEFEQGLGDGRDVGRLGGQEQVDDALAGQAGHGRAADVLGRGGRPTGGDEGDQAPGHLGGVRVGLVDLDRHPPVAADRWRGRPADVGVGGVRVDGPGANWSWLSSVGGDVRRSAARTK